MIDTSNQQSKKSGIGSLFLGLIVGGGAVAIVEESRIEALEKQRDALVTKGNDVIAESYPIVTAASLDANLPPPPGGYYPQGIPERLRETKAQAREHSHLFGEAVQAFQGEATKR